MDHFEDIDDFTEAHEAMYKYIEEYIRDNAKDVGTTADFVAGFHQGVIWVADFLRCKMEKMEEEDDGIS